MTRRRAVLYLRLSESDDASTSITRQEADLRARAEREGWEVVAVLVDDGLSGGKERDKETQALEMLRTGDADVLMVWKFDRWSRMGLGAVARLIETLDEVPRALFVADRDGLSSDQPTWRMVAGVLAELARMERENTQMRVRSSIQALRRSGRYAGGNLPFGYAPMPNPDGPGRILVINEEEAAIVREMAERALRGESLYAIMRDLNERKIPTRRGKTWSVQSIRQLLISDVIVGRIIHHGAVLRDPDGNPLDVWPPVLDHETWHRVRAHIGVNGTHSTTPPRRRAARLLSGLVVCSSCGSRLYARANGKGLIAYACSAKSNGVDCRRGVSVSAALLDAYVTEQFLAQTGHLDVVERVEETPEVAALAEVERGIRDTLDAMAEDDADVPTLSARLAALKERRADLRSRPREKVVRMVPTGETYAELWERADDAERAAVLRANISLLTVKPGRRGRTGLDPDRVVMVASPAYVEGAADDRAHVAHVVVA